MSNRQPHEPAHLRNADHHGGNLLVDIFKAAAILALIGLLFQPEIMSTASARITGAVQSLTQVQLFNPSPVLGALASTLEPSQGSAEPLFVASDEQPLLEPPRLHRVEFRRVEFSRSHYRTSSCGH